MLKLHPEDPVFGRGQGTMEVGLLVTTCSVQLPMSIDEPHPDLRALAALVICRPWIKRRLRVGHAVSRPFAETIRKILKIALEPIDDSLVPRAAGSTPLLAYSGGADSTAVSQLLPDGIPHIHHCRISHPRVPNRATHVRADAIEALVLEAGRRGRHVAVVRSDLEYLCHPYATLPHWLAIAVGPLLMADAFDGGAIALGGTLETFYMDMGRRWTGKGRGGLAPAADLVGLPFMRPAAGLTEIGTMAVTMQSDLADLSRSCLHGTMTEPCHQCVKCVRKDLALAALRGDRKLPATLAHLPTSSPSLKQLRGTPPLYMQAQLEFALARLNLRGSMLAKIAKRLKVNAAETDWMLRYYRPALADAVPAPWRSHVAEQVEKTVGYMTDSDVASAMAWSR